jgi:LysR family transcriptional regulator, nod-box dependent transcriptional activator
MILTARGEELIEPVRAVLEQIRTTVSVAPPFDPAKTDRIVRIMASDYSTEVLLAGLLVQLEKAAPHMRFEIQSMTDNPIDAIERGYIDLLLNIDCAISSDHPSQFLFEDDYVVVGDRDNPALAGPVTRQIYFELGHVTPRFGKARVPAFDDWFVRRQKQQRRIEVVAPTFLSLPGLVAGTNRVASMHRRMAEMMVRQSPLVMREIPFDIPPIRECVQWNIANNNDRALRWVVELMVAAANGDEDDAGNVVPFDGADGSGRDAIEVEYRMSHPQR